MRSILAATEPVFVSLVKRGLDVVPESEIMALAGHVAERMSNIDGTQASNSAAVGVKILIARLLSEHTVASTVAANRVHRSELAQFNSST